MGDWMTYISNESGSCAGVRAANAADRSEVAGLARAAGFQPQWRRDGGELFYVAPDKKLIGVTVVARPPGLEVRRARGPSWRRGWAAWDRRGGGAGPGILYAETADGKRFLVNTRDATRSLPVTLVLNWTATRKP